MQNCIAAVHIWPSLSISIWFRVKHIHLILLVLRNFEKENDDDKAAETYEKILKIDPGHHEASEALESMRDLKKSAAEWGIDLK